MVLCNGMEPGLDGETWVEFKTSHLLTMRVVKLHHVPGANQGFVTRGRLKQVTL